jgi:hypothetical protein
MHLHRKLFNSAWPHKLRANYAINPTPEQALRSNRAVLPARVIAALAVFGCPCGLATFPTMYYIA